MEITVGQRKKKGVNPKSLANLRPFKPGVSGNPNGRAMNAGESIKASWNMFASMSSEEIGAIADDESETAARRVAAKSFRRAIADDHAAIEQIIGHTDGKAKQAVEVNVSGRVEHAHLIHAAMEKMRSDPEAMQQAHALGERLLLNAENGDAREDAGSNGRGDLAIRASAIRELPE